MIGQKQKAKKNEGIFMTLKLRILLALFLVLLSSGCSHQREDTKEISYLGQSPPADVPHAFAPGIVSRGFHEHCIAIAPDGNEIVFGIASRDYAYYALIWIKRDGRIWKQPEILPFSTEYEAMAPRFSPDGERLYFSSRGGDTSKEKSNRNFDIYYLVREGDGWSEPIRMEAPINTEANEFAPAVSADKAG